MTQPTFFKSGQEFREWLQANHETAKELLLGFYKKGSGEEGITYAHALDEALCFGWIDGVRKTINEKSYTIRFTPRKPGSIWSAVNTKRAEELIALGAMQPPGFKVFNERDQNKTQQYSYEERSRPLDEEYERQFRVNKEAWAFFEAQPAYYRRSANWWIMSAKRDDTRQKRLAKLIEGSEKGERLVEITGEARHQGARARA